MSYFIFFPDFGALEQLHDHAEGLFPRRGFVEQVEHEGLQQGGLGL